MKTRIIYLCLLVIFSTTGCISKNARKGINGNKNIVTRTIQVDDFEEIHLGSNIESAKSINPFNKKNRAICNYTQTDGASSLEISMDENLFDLLDIENKDLYRRSTATTDKYVFLYQWRRRREIS